MEFTGLIMKTRYGYKNFREVPGPVLETLVGLAEYRSGNPFPSVYSHEDIASEIARSSPPPFSIIVFEEILDPAHIHDTRFVKITREEIISELDEVVYREFDREINERMARYLEKHRDLEDEYLHRLLREYHPKARSILREEYKEKHPRSWRKKFDARKISRPRTEVRRERLYSMPRPLCWWDGRNRYQQYFVMPAQMSVCQGGGAGSSQRETQSRFGFAFAIADGKRRVPTHVLAYDRHNRLLFVDTMRRLCLAPYDMGSNYDLPYPKARKLMKKVLKATTAGGIGRIDAVCIGSS
jgi:hypothetical protein